ncbi:MAG: hypothetical protein L3J43_04835 [Sulfurovum sp.]|nr:hypothetical protein [Sulfurovum sp.]
MKTVITFGSNHLSWMHHKLNPMNVALVIDAENENEARSQVLQSRIGENFATSYTYAQYKEAFSTKYMREFTLGELEANSIISKLSFKEMAYYKYAYKMLDNGTRIAIVIDLHREDAVSVTNSIEIIAKNLHTEHIIYFTTDKEWWYWNKKKSYCPLVLENGVNGDLMSAPTFDIAWDILKAKYLKETP